MKVLFVTLNRIGDLSYGGGQCTTRNLEGLKQIADVDTYQIRRENKIQNLIALVNLSFPPLDMTTKKRILSKFMKTHYDLVFLDSSLLGGIAQKMKINRPECKILVFFHNVEYDYNRNVRFFKNSLQKYIYQFMAKRMEKKALQFCDKSIVLSKRDELRVMALYGYQIDEILPVTFADVFNENDADLKNPFKEERVGLLVGSYKADTFEGFNWFCKQVSPHIKAHTYIIGRGFEEVRGKLESEKVTVIGSVPRLGEYYAHADFVALPIFSGAGMKVKTAEALMYGKTMFGTKEAFEGYDIDFPKCGLLCETAEEYIEGINRYLDDVQSKINQHCRTIFKRLYSKAASDESIEKIVASTLMN